MLHRKEVLFTCCDERPYYPGHDRSTDGFTVAALMGSGLLLSTRRFSA